MSKTYTLTLTEQQMQLLERALGRSVEKFEHDIAALQNDYDDFYDEVPIVRNVIALKQTRVDQMTVIRDLILNTVYPGWDKPIDTTDKQEK